MALPDSYTTKPGSIEAYFNAMLDAEAPERFSQSFLEGLDFKSTNDRAFIRVLKDLGFVDADGVPKERYFEFLDRSQAQRVVAEGVREAYSDLFAINKRANGLSAEEVKNKLRTLYKGAKKDGLIARIASTFTALCEYGDFDATDPDVTRKPDPTLEASDAQPLKSAATAKQATGQADKSGSLRPIGLESLQYHINIVLPESRDQAVYDALFKSLREHLGD